ncbi:hypothetical protein X975_14270, partial [Stegodyphus mimosarum]
MVVNLAKAHPTSLKSSQTKDASRLKHMRDLKIWEQHIKNGGTRKDKYNTIDSWTYDRFVEARYVVTSKSPQEPCNNGHLLLPVNFQSWNSKP